MSIFGGPAEPVLHIGATVHYVMRAEDYMPGAVRKGYEHRPAIVVDLPPKPEVPAEPWPLSLVVILAGAEDGLPVPVSPVPPDDPPKPPCNCPTPVTCTMWRKGILYSAEHMPGTWHWPEAA